MKVWGNVSFRFQGTLNILPHILVSLKEVSGAEVDREVSSRRSGRRQVPARAKINLEGVIYLNVFCRNKLVINVNAAALFSKGLLYSHSVSILDRINPRFFNVQKPFKYKNVRLVQGPLGVYLKNILNF